MRLRPAMAVPARGMASAQDEELDQIREAVRGLCADFPGTYWRNLDDKSEYPTKFVQAMQEAGYLSMLIPEEYGGSGLGLQAACAVLEEVHASGCNGGAAHAQMYTMGTILRHGSEEQKQKYLPKIASGELRLQAFGVSEPNSGTDTLSLETAATKIGDEYSINGQKMWTSRAEYSDLMVLLARTAPNDESDRKARARALSCFVVEMRQPGDDTLIKGMEITKVPTMMNHSTTTIFFDDVRIPADNIVGNEGDGLKCILTSMNAERLLIAAECIGDARYFTQRSVQYAKDRNVFGRAIGQNQGIQFPIAKAYSQYKAASLMVQKGAELYDDGESCGEEANMAKMLAADASWEAADVCIQTHGGYGFAKEFDIERKFRETRLYRVAPISTNLILSFLSEKVLGLPRSY
jgi:alkylation response protein AidB-like acyl-CoA dehydrogenase